MSVVFYLREMRAAEPVINPRLFQNRVFSVSALASALQSAAMFGAIMFLPLFVQGVQGKSATNSGIILMPLMIGAMVMSIGAGQILARTGRYKVLVICGFVTVSIGAWLLSRMGVDTSWTVLARNMVIMGLGLGIAMSAFTVIVQNQYPSHRLGEVTAGLQFFRSIGATIGMAVFGTILNNQFAAHMKENLPAQLSQAMAKRGASIDNPQVLLSEQARAALQHAFAQFGAQGEKLFTVFMDAVRQSLAERHRRPVPAGGDPRRRRADRGALPARGPAAQDAPHRRRERRAGQREPATSRSSTARRTPSPESA